MYYDYDQENHTCYLYDENCEIIDRKILNVHECLLLTSFFNIIFSSSDDLGDFNEETSQVDPAPF